MIKAILLSLLFSYSAISADCNYNVDVNTYKHGNIELDLKKLTQRAMDSKGYKYQVKRSSLRSNIKIRILKRDGREDIRLFYNLYRYRNHLIHYYQPHKCKSELCIGSEVDLALMALFKKIKKEVPSCETL